jgi:hypothetical protein
MISEAQHQREREIAERLKAPKAFAAFYAGKCRCGATWLPGDVIFRSPFPRGPRPTCLDCGIRRQEASK